MPFNFQFDPPFIKHYLIRFNCAVGYVVVHPQPNNNWEGGKKNKTEKKQWACSDWIDILLATKNTTSCSSREKNHTTWREGMPFPFPFFLINLIYILDRKLFFHQIVVILTFLWLLWWQNMYLPVTGSLHSCNSLDFLATHLQGWKIIILYFLVQAFICDQAPFYTSLKITVNFDFKYWNLT